jgi:hypothetical protein
MKHVFVYSKIKKPRKVRQFLRLRLARPVSDVMPEIHQKFAQFLLFTRSMAYND